MHTTCSDRNWTVLFIGGASGTGKSRLAYEIGRFYSVNVLEVDDIHLTIEKVTTAQNFPAIHYWSTGIDWKDIGVSGNLNWLIDVSKEMTPVLKELADRHVEDQVPIIIEGDFISPELAASFDHSQIKSIFVQETDQQRIIQNYYSREGGALQEYRAEISVAYNGWLKAACTQNNVQLFNARPWDTALSRVKEYLR